MNLRVTTPGGLLLRPFRANLGAWQRQILVLWVSALAYASAAGVTFPEFKAETAREYLRKVVSSVETEAEMDARACFVLARVKSELGEKDQAERLARRALEQEPKRADIMEFMARLLILEDRMEEAAGFLKRALELQPALPGGQRQLGMALDRLGDHEGARKAFEIGIHLAPKDATARFLLGRLLLDQGQVQEAARHLELACQLDPNEAGAFYLLAQVQQRLGDFDAARRSLQAFQQLKRKEKEQLDARNASYNDDKFMRALATGFHAEVADLFLQQQKPALAEAHLRQAVLVAPQETHGYERLAAFLLQARRVQEARAPCEALVRLRPNEAGYRANLGTVLLQLKQYPAAVEELKRALELDTHQPQALNNLARFYLGTRRNVAEALELSRRLVEQSPEAANYDLLGWALYANNQKAAARDATARAVEIDPANPLYRERLQKLSQAP